MDTDRFDLSLKTDPRAPADGAPWDCVVVSARTTGADFAVFVSVFACVRDRLLDDADGGQCPRVGWLGARGFDPESE